MIKKITLLIFLMLYSYAISLGQVASLENKTVSPNTTTSADLSVTSLTNINALTLKIGFSSDVLDFAGLSNQGLSGMTVNLTGNTIIIGWTSTVAVTPPALLCKLNFYYKGGTSELSFLPGCEVIQGTNPLITGFLNGSISPAPCQPGDGVATIGNASCSSGLPFMVPVTLSNFPVTGSFTLKVAFDPVKFSFINLNAGGTLAGAQVGVTGGIVNIAWSSSSGSNINTSAFNFLKLNFMCNMPGNSTLSFAPGSEFNNTNIPVPAIIPVCFHSGAIIQTPTANNAKIDTITGVNQGDLVHLPLFLNVADPVGAFTMNINFNSPVLSFAGIEIVNPLASNVIYSVAGNTLNLVYENYSSPVAFSGEFLKLKLHYNGMGSGNISFTGSCQFSDFAAQPINVTFTNGYIAPGFNPANSSVEIASINANVNEVVDLPVIIDGGASNPIRAATMFIGYDNAKLAFIGAVDALPGTVVENIGNQISIAWADATGVSFTNSTFLKLKFKYIGGGSTGCGSQIYFTNDEITSQACELASGLATTIPANWVNGGLNLDPGVATISGQANPLVGSTIGYNTESGKMNYSWALSGGGSFSSGSGLPSISVLWNSIGTSLLSVHYHNQGGCYLGAEKQITVLPTGILTDLEGYVSYDNASNQGMNGVQIQLFNSLGAPVGGPLTTVTNGGNHGYYHYSAIPEDYYTMNVISSAPWAGPPFVSGLDALLVELHATGFFWLTGIRLLAANVNTGSTVNATDALLIKKRIIGEISSFPAGDWVFNNGVINCFTFPITSYNFKGICIGDVNGSYDPVVGVKSTGNMSVSDQVIQSEALNTVFKYTVQSGLNTSLGEMTLYFSFDPGKVEIKSISSPFEGLEYSVQNGKVSMVWSDPGGKMISENDVLVTFEMVMKNGFEQPVCPFVISSGCEMADPMANLIDNASIKMSKLTQKSSEFSLNILPNPIVSKGTINFSIPEEGKVRIDLANICGSRMMSLTDANYQSGDHSISFDVNSINLTSGIYFATLHYESGQNQITKVVKLIIKK